MKNNLIWIIFDSCPYDTFCSAHIPTMSRLGKIERRYAYASWTVPSHAVYLMGVSPHQNTPKILASEVYKKDFHNWSTRLNIPNISFHQFLPRLSLPSFLHDHGYRTKAYVSMPVLNQNTIINQHFDHYELMESHNDFNAILDKLSFDPYQPSFHFINTGETHYPYTLAGESAEDLPRLHGIHGAIKHMNDSSEDAVGWSEDMISIEHLQPLKAKQQRNVEQLDRYFEKLFDLIPSHTHIMVTSDHGELFGEDGYFGHGPIMHPKVFEVFWLEGRKP